MKELARRPWVAVSLLSLALAAWASCSGPPEDSEDTAERCSDGIDNDGDGAVDCRDVQCAAFCAADGDADTDTDSDVDSDSDSDSDGETDGDRETDGGVVECTEVGELCLDGAIVECAAVGSAPEVLLDCTEAPYERCALGTCETGATAPGPCCVADAPFCHAIVGVEGEDAFETDYAGLWDGDHGCTGYLVDGTTFMFLVTSRMIACELGFVQVTIQGAIAELTPGEPEPICRAGRAVVRVTMAVTETGAGGELVNVTYSADDCSRASGTLTLRSYGTSSAAPFDFELSATLYDASRGASRDLTVSADGSVVVL